MGSTIWNIKKNKKCPNFWTLYINFFYFNDSIMDKICNIINSHSEYEKDIYIITYYVKKSYSESLTDNFEISEYISDCLYQYLSNYDNIIKYYDEYSTTVLMYNINNEFYWILSIEFV